MTRSKSTVRRFADAGLGLIALFAFVLGGPCTAFGQQITGTIVGTVKDAQGAVVNTATIKATNTGTGFTRSVPANGYGDYRIEYLPVGTYTVEVNAAGFEKFVQQNVVLTVDQTQTVNILLTIGAQSQTVTVSTAPPLVNTSTAELGRTVEPAEIIGLPLVNRNAYSQLSLTPGVQANSASQFSNPSGTPNFTIGIPSTDVVINGGVDEGVPMVSYYLDGGINMSGVRNYGNPVPDPDALEEFRVETNNYSAQYGRMGGGVVTVVTKSGTNQFHGSLFEFNRNTDFNAYPWGSKTNNPYHRNQFGGTLGGPVKRNRAFFFFSYGGLRQDVGQQLTGAIPPTALQREGDFTQNVTSTNPIPDMPGTKTPWMGTNSSPNCQIPKAGCVPSSALDPTAANIMAKLNVPLPNTPTGGWTGFYTTPTDEDEYLGKYNQDFGDKDHVAVTYFNIHTTSGAYGGGNLLWSVNQSFSRQQNVNISDVHTFSPTTANQAWLTVVRVAAGRVNLPATPLSAFGSSFTIQGVPSLPEITASGYFTVGGALAGPVSNSNFYSLRDIVSMTKGKHSIDYGGEISLEHDPLLGNLENFGNFSFSNSGPTTTGNSLADFISGNVASMEQDTPYHGLMTNWYFAGFAQDVYRILPRFTINMGLRYDVETSPVESSNLTATFVPGVQSTVVPSAPLGMLFPGDRGVPRGIAATRYHHISPRLGLAWDPFGDGKTAVRAGAGVFYGEVTANQWNQPANAQPFAVRQTFSSITSFSNVYGTTLPNGSPSSFPTGDIFPYVYNPQNPRFLPAASIETISKNYQWPLTYQLNMAIERQLPGQVSVTTAYVASLSHDVPFTTDFNYPAWAPGASTSQASINARRPYDPGVLGQIQYLESTPTASYHSLQISARKRMTHNLTLSGFYVLSKSFESADGSATGIGGETQDYDNLQEERGPTDNDQRHMAVISGIWNLDYYKGSSFALRELANGWTISPIVTLNSGLPINMLTGINENDDSYGNNRPNLVPGVSPFLNPHRPRAQAAAEWFNPAAFIKNGSGVPGGIGPGGADGNTPRDSLRAPGYRDVDLGIFRDVHLERGMVLQIRGEATNAFNLVSLTAPTANLDSANDGKILSAYSPRVIQLGIRLTF